MKSFDQDLLNMIELSESYNDELVIFNYFVSKLLDSAQLHYSPTDNLEKLYEYENKILLHLDEFNEKFISNLLTHEPNNSVSLDDDLINIYCKYRSHTYG
jgi:hypothetical protein